MDDLVRGVQEGDSIAHVGQDLLALVTLLLEGREARAHLPRHRVHRAAQAADLVGRQLAGARGKRSPADLLGNARQFPDSRRMPARHPEDDDQRDHERACGASQPETEEGAGALFELLEGFGQAEGRDSINVRRGNGHVEVPVVDRVASPHVVRGMSVERGPHLGPRGVVLDMGELRPGDLRIAQDTAGRVDQRDAVADVARQVGRNRGPVPVSCRGSGRKVGDQVVGHLLNRLGLASDEPPPVLPAGDDRSGRKGDGKQNGVGKEQSRPER